jgi:hypothetical protein
LEWVDTVVPAAPAPVEAVPAVEAKPEEKK